jgi:3-phenylpropionate/trans-cinnamate dioxygenase ferredoxin reductase subunit
VSGAARVLIIGASAAGTATAWALRDAGHQGPVTLVGAETELPYDRPPLSKDILTGAWQPKRAYLHDASEYTARSITMRLGTSATRLDPGSRTVQLSDGTTEPYDELVIATGVRARRLPLMDGLRNVHYLRTLADALALRTALARAPRLLIVGGGFVGLEVAAAARTLGCEVDVIEQRDIPLADRLGERLGRQVVALHRDRGVRVHAGQSVTRVRSAGHLLTGVELSGGAMISADAALVGIGTSPAVHWLGDSGLDIADGVACDERLRAAPNIWTAGDVACPVDPRANRRQRVEHRSTASEHARRVASGITGGEQPPGAPPFVWTDQYDVKIQLFGTPNEGSAVEIAEGDIADARFVAVYRTGDRIDAVLGWNAARALIPYRRELHAAYRSTELV